MSTVAEALQLLSRVLTCEACCPAERALVAEFLGRANVVRCSRCGFPVFEGDECSCSAHAARSHEHGWSPVAA